MLGSPVQRVQAGSRVEWKATSSSAEQRHDGVLWSTKCLQRRSYGHGNAVREPMLDNDDLL